MDTLIKVNLILLDEMIKLNDKFVDEAMQEWDKGYTGSFYEFIYDYVIARWHDLVESN